MKRYGVRILLGITCLLSFGQVIAQELNFNRINIQGQLMPSSYTEADFEFLVISLTGDTLWRESHSTIALSDEGAFTLPFGSGTYISGEVINFNELNWFDTEKVELYHLGTSRYLQGAFYVQSVPYAFHSLHVLSVPPTTELIDVTDDPIGLNATLVFDGEAYILGSDEVGSFATFAWDADSVSYTDTAWVAINESFADTSLYSYFSDSANIALTMNHVTYSDTAAYTDSVGYAISSSGNWSIYGDVGLTTDHFIGPTIMESLVVRTNNTPRCTFGDNHSIHNNFPGVGFRVQTEDGILFTPNTNLGLTEMDSSYLYFDGETYSFHGGVNVGAKDTLKGIYSFAWGENVGTNGTYSTVFGKDTYGDTAYFGGTTPYDAISSFAMGRNCRVAHMGFAFGDSAIANYYRNVAIGKNVTANTASAAFAMGNNVIATGATTWAAGQNLTASGHFSTVLGSNASSNLKVGSFVFGDHSTTDTVKNTVNHQFMVRADGGVIFYSSSDLSMGVELLPGAGSWSMVSDKNKKRNISQLNPVDYEPTFEDLSVFSWNYIGNSVVHIGPMAQDFYGLFDVGEKPYYINMIDSDGATFLGVKMLNAGLNELPTNEEVEEIQEDLDKEKLELEQIERRINELYEELDHN